MVGVVKFDAYLGRGYNRFTDDQLQSIIDFSVTEGVATAESNVYKCDTAEDITTVLEISGSLGVDAPVVQIDAKASYLDKLTEHSNSITYIVKVKKSWTAELTDPRFKISDTDIAEALKTPDKIVNYAGDSYISSVVVGVEYYAAFQFHAQTSEQRKNISADVTFSAGVGTKVTGGLKAQFDRIQTDSKTTYKVYQKLIGDSSLAEPTEEGIAAFALELAEKDVPHPELLTFRTSSYGDLLNAPPGFERIKNWTDAYLRPGWYKNSIRAIERSAKITEPIIRGIIKLYEFYGAAPSAMEKLYHNANGCSSAQETIRNWKLKFDGGNAALEKPVIDIECLKVPQANFAFQNGWTWGRDGEGWTEFDPQFIYAFGYPKTFRVRAENLISEIITVYGFANNPDPNDAQKEMTSETTHGSHNIGSEVPFGIYFKPRDVTYTGAWKSADGNRSGFICAFEVYLTSQGNKAQILGSSDRGPYTGEGVPQGCCFIGFQGKTSYGAIANLQPVYVKFEAPTWKEATIGK